MKLVWSAAVLIFILNLRTTLSQNQPKGRLVYILPQNEDFYYTRPILHPTYATEQVQPQIIHYNRKSGFNTKRRPIVEQYLKEVTPTTKTVAYPQELPDQTTFRNEEESHLKPNSRQYVYVYNNQPEEYNRPTTKPVETEDYTTAHRTESYYQQTTLPVAKPRYIHIVPFQQQIINKKSALAVSNDPDQRSETESGYQVQMVPLVAKTSPASFENIQRHLDSEGVIEIPLPKRKATGRARVELKPRYREIPEGNQGIRYYFRAGLADSF